VNMEALGFLMHSLLSANAWHIIGYWFWWRPAADQPVLEYCYLLNKSRQCWELLIM
jgi:hypothetical protein